VAGGSFPASEPIMVKPRIRSSFPLAVLHAEYPRRQTRKPMEISGKMTLVRESHLQRDVVSIRGRECSRTLRSHHGVANNVRDIGEHPRGRPV
jgi:hypothetical protein